MLFLPVSSGEEAAVQSAHDDLRDTIDLHHREGTVVTNDRNMLGGILDLAELQVADVMVHRTKMETVDADASLAEVLSAIIGSAHSRLPVWRGSPENIVGVLHVRDLLREATATAVAAGRSSRDLAGPPWFVPDTTPLNDQLAAFLKRKAHLALVVEEYGEVMGLVTLEDILEVIVGEITDEHDRADVADPPAYRRLGAGRRQRTDPRCQSGDELEPAGRRGDDDRRPGHPRSAADPGIGPDVHLPRLPLRGRCGRPATASSPIKVTLIDGGKRRQAVGSRQ